MQGSPWWGVVPGGVWCWLWLWFWFCHHARTKPKTNPNQSKDTKTLIPNQKTKNQSSRHYYPPYTKPKFKTLLPPPVWAQETPPRESHGIALYAMRSSGTTARQFQIPDAQAAVQGARGATEGAEEHANRADIMPQAPERRPCRRCAEEKPVVLMSLIEGFDERSRAC